MATEDINPLHVTALTEDTLTGEPSVYFKTEGDFFLGYRWVSTEDSLKSAEYIYPHSSVAFGLNLLSCPLPYRYHINTEFLNNYDFYTDGGFAYNDLLLFRDILVGTYHNLDHFNYQSAGEPPGLIYSDRNASDNYNISYIDNLFSLRLKAPDFPFHTFLRHRHVEREGTIQQRFLLGDFGDVNKISQSRDIDWKSNTYTLGANSHAGPIEIEYTYDPAEFNPGRNSILYDTYPADTSRPSDVYPHNVVPETESSAHSIKLHSSYTGGVVAGATLSNLHQKNNYSYTESTTWKGAVDFSWIPDPVLGLFFKYRRSNIDMDTPNTVTLNGVNNTLNYSVRQGISSDKDVFSLSARYRPLNILSLLATYKFSHLERDDVEEWVVLPRKTDIHSIHFTAQANPIDKVKLKAIYEYKNYNDPAYNTSPDNSNKLRLTTTYTPVFWMNVYLEYLLSFSGRDSLHSLNNDPSVLLKNGEREERRDQFLVSLSTQLSPKTSLTASWFYQRWDVDQDLAYGKSSITGTGDLPYVDGDVPYTDESNSFSLSLFYTPRKDISLSADASYTITKGETGYDTVVAGAPFSLSTFSELKASETILSLEITKKLSSDWEIGIRSHLDIYDDQAYDLLDGNTFTTILSVKRYF
jgi:hypothetical protein